MIHHTKRVILQEQANGYWRAIHEGQSSPVLRKVPGNTSPAHAAEWPTREAAIDELMIMCGCEILVSRTEWHQREADLRARLSLETRDEPRQYESNIEPSTGLRRHGEI